MPSLSHLRLSGLALALCLMASCHSDKSGDAQAPALKPPAGVGLVTIDMDGRWEITSVQCLDPITLDPIGCPPMTTSPNQTRVFFPPRVGHLIDISNKTARSIQGSPLFFYNPAQKPDRYLNQANGQTFIFRTSLRQTDPCFYEMDLQVALGTVSHTTLDGYVSGREIFGGGCTRVAIALDPPDGMFRVQLTRR